jgi:hypothetical protein
MIVEAERGPIVFMKVGKHAGETFEEILERKRQEYRQTGRIFWGYGGGTMHPIHRVQPFARMHLEQGERVTLVMEEVNSGHPPTSVFANQYSADGIDWTKVPDGIKVRGSRYALVLDEILEGDLNLDLSLFQVGTGPSAGAVASEYLRGRVDKGCLELRSLSEPRRESKLVHVKYTAVLREPYAVLLRNDRD